jgi:hypothetical protein
MRVALAAIVKPGVLYTTFHCPEVSINHLASDGGDAFTLHPERLEASWGPLAAPSG